MEPDWTQLNPQDAEAWMTSVTRLLTHLGLGSGFTSDVRDVLIAYNKATDSDWPLD